MIVLCLFMAYTAFSQGSGNALRVDGTDDFLSFTKVNLPAGLTFSAWVRNAGGASGGNYIGNPARTILGDHTDDVQLSFGIDGGFLQYNHFDGSTWKSVNGSTLVADGSWHHVAVTHDPASGEIVLYLDGEVDGNGNITYGGLDASKVGVDRICGGYSNGIDTDDFYVGLIDEVAIFSVVVDEATIEEWLCKTITGAHPYTDDLVAYFQLDEGTGTTSADASSSSLTADLNNGPLWKGSGAAIGDELNFVAAASLGSSVVLAHPNGDRVTVTVTAGTANTIYIYRVDEEPDVTTPPFSLNQLSTINYFGVRAFGASGLDFEVSYDYDGHPGIVDENNLRLCYRKLNSTSFWTLESGAVLDVSANTLTLAGETGGEYILGSTATNPLPVELLYFKASLNEVDQVALSWSTVTEIDNEFFSIERSSNGSDWQAIMDLPGAGNSSEILSYQTIDRSPLSGTSYYRLKQTDFDGQYSYSEVQVVERILDGSLGVSPTLGNGLFYLKNTQAEDLSINLFDTTGALRKSWTITSGGTSTELDLQAFPSGWYYLQVNEETFSIYKQ